MLGEPNTLTALILSFPDLGSSCNVLCVRAFPESAINLILRLDDERTGVAALRVVCDRIGVDLASVVIGVSRWQCQGWLKGIRHMPRPARKWARHVAKLSDAEIEELVLEAFAVVETSDDGKDAPDTP